MIVIGTDTHKGSHALAAVDGGTGRLCGQREIKADEGGHLAAVRWARDLDEERVWAIEDCRTVSLRFEQALITAGERVVRVAPHRMGASRKGERQLGKSDQIDALAIARAVVKDGVERFPVAYLNEQAMEIRLLCDHRKQLVEERTRTKNRLRWHLLQLLPELEAKLTRDQFNRLSALERIDRRLRRLSGQRVRVARQQLTQARALTRQIQAIEAELAALVAAHRPELLKEHGCGTLTAATLIGHTAGVQRFRSDSSFAQQAGTAPIPCSSGKQSKHRLNRGGDRQLNHALHIIALNRLRCDLTTQQYIARKLAEGHTKKGALRCLKRHLARRFHHLLTSTPDAPASPPTRRRDGDRVTLGAAPTPMVCVS